MFTLTVKTGNEAFSDGNLALELARILRKAAERLEAGETDGRLRDCNGNTVGTFTVETDR